MQFLNKSANELSEWLDDIFSDELFVVIPMVVIVCLASIFAIIRDSHYSLPSLEEMEHIEGEVEECLWKPAINQAIKISLKDGNSYYLYGYIYDGVDSSELINNLKNGDSIILDVYYWDGSVLNPRIASITINGMEYLTYKEAVEIYEKGIQKNISAAYSGIFICLLILIVLSVRYLIWLYR